MKTNKNSYRRVLSNAPTGTGNVCCLSRRNRGLSAVIGVAVTTFAMTLFAPPRANAQTASPRHGLLLSDIHFDPYAVGVPTASQLAQSPVDGWDSILQPFKNDPFAKAGQDANYSLMTSALDNAKSQVSGDIVIYTGDVLCHDFNTQFEKDKITGTQWPVFATKTAVYMVRKMQATLAAPVIFAFGNNDSSEGDYVMSTDNDMFAALAMELKALADSPEARATFRHGGYYTIPHPTVPNQDIVVLNSVFWSRKYSNDTLGFSDPGEEELKWLDRTLAAAQSKKHGVTLVMHIPPGDDAYKSAPPKGSKVFETLWKKDKDEDYVKAFSKMMKNYKDVVKIAFAGHTHMDDFRLMYDGKTPFLPFRLTPSIGRNNFNNPGFSEYDYDPTTADVIDIATYRAPNAPGMPWPLEYRFSEAYGYKAFNATNLDLLANSIRMDATVRSAWELHYAVSAKSPINDADWQYYSCAQTNFTSSDYLDCLKKHSAQ